MKMYLTAVMALVASALVAEMPRSEWLARVGDSAQNPQHLKATISQLSKADQVAFVSEVNAAIANMPGSAESKAAAFLAANRAAVSGASKEARLEVLSEVFATLPVEVMSVVVEDFAKSLFDRNADSINVYTDNEYTEIAKKAVDAIAYRTQSVENGDIRTTFAIVLFTLASGGTPAGLPDELANSIANEEARNNAKNEWLKDALGRDGRTQSYDSMLGAAQAGEEPDHTIVVSYAPIQTHDSLLADIRNDVTSVARVGVSTVPGGITSLVGSGADLLNSASEMIPRDAILNPEVEGGKYNSKDRDHTYQDQVP